MSRLSAGILFMFCASFFFALMNAFVKILSPTISPVENIFFRSLLMAIFMGIFILLKKEKTKKKPGGWVGLFFRSLMGGISLMALFYNIATIPLGTATTFAQSMPLYAIFFSALILKDRISLPNFLATLLGFTGIIFICNPAESSLNSINIIMGILSGGGAALALVTLHTLKDYFHNHFIIFCFGASMAIASLIAFFIPHFFMDNSWKTPNLTESLLLFFMALAGTLGQHFLTKAYMSAPPGIVAPIDYIKIVWGILMGVYLGDKLPDLRSSVGITLVVCSGLIIALPIFLKDMKAIKRKK